GRRRLAEHLGDPQGVAGPDNADADLGVAAVQDVVAVVRRVHEGDVHGVDRGAGADVLAHRVPTLDLSGEVGVVVEAPAARHLLGVLPGDGDQVVGDGRGTDAPARPLLVGAGHEVALGAGVHAGGGAGGARQRQ